MPFLLDTNVLSEMRRPVPAPQVAAFLEACSVSEQFMSVVTIAEIRFGIELQQDRVKRAAINEWLETTIRSMYAGQILETSEEILVRWRLLLEDGRKSGRTYSPFDSLIAATALHHGLAVVTRNVSDFQGLGLEIVDPWNL